jgi:tetratricopeptide (TPR) repeat protein
MPAYLAGVAPESGRRLAEVNAAGDAALRKYLASGKAVAFLGAGASAPLYPLWQAVIAELIDAGVARGLGSEAAVTCRELAGDQPDAVVELLSQHLGTAQYREALRQVFRVRRDPESGRTWTPVQELVCRCPFRAVVTTNYDPGIVDARMRVRPRASGTGFASWTDELALDRWRTGDVFGDDELPVLFAHGHHNQPDAMVLAATEYRRAYAGKLSRVLASMIDSWHLVWIGFSFTDQRIGGVLREVAEHSGTRIDPGGPARHVAIMAWDPDGGRDPETLRQLARIHYGADLILYPAPGGDHAALRSLLAEFTVAQYPPVAALSAPPSGIRRPVMPVRWVPAAEVVEHFTGRVEELARLDRWAADPTVGLVGVTAWGGAGKTALVTHWIQRHGGARARATRASVLVAVASSPRSPARSAVGSRSASRAPSTDTASACPSTPATRSRRWASGSHAPPAAASRAAPSAGVNGGTSSIRAAPPSKVSRVLRFYADRLAEADRYLVAALALFTHPITPEAILTVATHPAFDGTLDGWTPQQVHHTARHRLAGLLSCHPDGTLSAHPLVRDTFRRLALGAAEVAAEATLTGLPAGPISNREDGLRVVEAIELLLDADQWQAADDLYRNRTRNGEAWKHLPAARLGQRAASAFVATPARQQHCPTRLTPRHLGFYLTSVGLFAMISGDLATADEYLNKGISHHRTAADLTNEAIGLRNLSDCLAYLGEIDQGLRVAAHAATQAAEANDRNEIRNSAAYRGWLMMLAGETTAAEKQFEDYPDSGHLSITGTWRGAFLARTGRAGPAQQLTHQNRAICVMRGWNADVARCDRLLGQLALLWSDTAAAAPRLAAATQTFRDGDHLVELAETLPVLAECARRTGDLDAAERHATEAITIAAPRQLRPAQAAALTVRAKIDADRAATGNPDYLQRGRDAADAAYRIATGHRLAWHELDALDAHAHLDQAEGTDHGWATKAATQRNRLIPDGLHPDLLTTVERLIAKTGKNHPPNRRRVSDI